MSQHGLSKSKIVAWKQCPKRLWLEVYRKDLIVVTKEAQRRFQVGHEVGHLAQQHNPDGIMIQDEDLTKAIKPTISAMSEYPDRPIFEATFQSDTVLIRADLLLPSTDGYRLVEVKSSTSVKQTHIDDCAVQAWVLKENGIPINSIELAHIDTTFVYQGVGDYHGIFRLEKLDEAVFPLMDCVPNWIQDARKTLSGEMPDIQMGNQCDDPYPCAFKDYCSAQYPVKNPPEFPLDILPRLNKANKENLIALGIEDARLVPIVHLNETQRRVQRVTQTGKAEFNSNKAAEAFSGLTYPRYYLDFETINMAIPRWAQTSPQRTQVPFQWSCHTENSYRHLSHDMFLDVSGNDPRRACAEQMITAFGKNGPVFVYYQAFEKSRIAELAALFPDLAPALLAINGRIIDLLPIARANYYHSDMKGSWSIKAVLPTIAPDLNYTHLTVGNGGDAQAAYLDIINPDTPKDRKQELVAGLSEYCKLDTLALVRLAWFFQGKKWHISQKFFIDDIKRRSSLDNGISTNCPRVINELRFF